MQPEIRAQVLGMLEMLFSLLHHFDVIVGIDTGEEFSQVILIRYQLETYTGSFLYEPSNYITNPNMLKAGLRSHFQKLQLSGKAEEARKALLELVAA